MTNNKLRVLSYNIHKGFGLTGRSFVLKGIREAICKVEPDLVFLQEVQGENSKHAALISDWPKAPQFEFLAEGIWSHSVYGKNAIYDHGHHGNAILSKFPICEWSNMDISTNILEARGVLHAVIETASNIRLHCMCVHLNLLRGGRTTQLAQIVKRIVSDVPSSEPLIIAGDFNDWTQKASQVLCDETGVSETFRKMYGKYAATFPAKFPLFRIDRIYCRGFEVLDAQVLSGLPWSGLSDHAALYNELQVCS